MTHRPKTAGTRSDGVIKEHSMIIGDRPQPDVTNPDQLCPRMVVSARQTLIEGAGDKLNEVRQLLICVLTPFVEPRLNCQSLWRVERWV
jgi:hypothetical protein